MLRAMEEHRWDIFVTGDYRTAYYLSGTLATADTPIAFLLHADGRHQALTAETYSIEQVIDRPVEDLAGKLNDVLSGSAASTAGVERSATAALLDNAVHNRVPSVEDASQTVLQLRRRKDDDEVEEIRSSLRLCAAAYGVARGAVVPGASELDVFYALNRAVSRTAGTIVPFPGDFASGERAIRRGGPPTSRVLERHDLYPLDLFPAPALYFGDTCRTFAAGGATDEQLRAHEIVRAALRVGESLVKPGVRVREVYKAVKEFLDSEPLTERSFWHHLGHGIGFHGHEAPRIIPGSDEIFQVGDVFTLEPGVYTKRLQGGIRLEDNYLLTETGLENLFADVEMCL